MAEADSPSAWRDIRGVGFAERAPLARAWAWLDAAPFVPACETMPAAQAIGRVLAADVSASRDLPTTDRAAIDGFAVRAGDTESAGIYNPLLLALSDSPGAGSAVPVFAGAPLPPGADAVVAFSSVSGSAPGHLQVIVEAAAGEGIAPRGGALRAGAMALCRGRRLRPPDLALLAMLGIEDVTVFARPRTRLVVAGPKGGDAEALAAMLRALVVRDGGVPSGGVCKWFGEAIAMAAEADVILTAGRSGAGEDDVAAPTLVEVGGEMAMHGIAMRPGASSGLGRLRGKVVLLLPGSPLACLIAYDMLAGRLIRRLGGFSLDLPYPCATYPLGRKIVSAIGITDVVPVALAGEAAVPIASAESAELAASCRADGFVVVPEALEGYAEGETVAVCLYDGFGRHLYSRA